jgi:hypothetical protein
MHGLHQVRLEVLVIVRKRPKRKVFWNARTVLESDLRTGFEQAHLWTTMGG